ncbi:Uncharacterized protein conserved in bacteria [Oligella ureolytica]|uniref:DUF484 family protein n=1 Tax=Oligella ureolytica TaxID=90244 RepID=A0A378XI69_9BURK|nr:DUF484 family protein [Oligella ureolytica]QPT39367.1 DUF484 family protein [Oligella ureolytica]SUA55880.1 Uncharacterized protein conserved in bacteria [Oligella ureolytica]SUA57240.1 Uncharacterized protein conserved in bacteria [Oligella ureolytica]
MTAEKLLTAQEVAAFLQQNPSFFKEHADVFQSMEIEDADSGGTLSLAQRQMLDLRNKLKQQDFHLKELSLYAMENQNISQSILQWCVYMLAEEESSELPQLCVESLEHCFTGLKVALKLWPCPEYVPARFGGVSPELKKHVEALEKPYCGQEYPEEIDSWFEDKPASVAVLPLDDETAVIGVLVFASDDLDHFTEQMGLSFLLIISALAGAALGRTML